MRKEIIKVNQEISFFSIEEPKYIELIHVMADENKVLTDGEVITKEIYFSKLDPTNHWEEIDYDYLDGGDEL